MRNEELCRFNPHRFKERQDGVVRKAFGEMEANGSAPNVYTPSPVAGLTASGCFYNNSGHSRRIRERESLIPSLGPQRTAESVVSFASRVSCAVTFSLVSDVY